jgi:ribonucleoside-diphosphate reductase alpha chain
MSNCYILPSPEDNIESIFDVATKQARIYSYGGGTGVNISKLRPNEATVNNSALTSSGSVSFMELFNTVGKIIGASNKKKGETVARRAALLVGLNCSHPDFEEFLEIKQNNEAIQSANISILFDDKFMKAVENHTDYELYFKVESTGQEIRKTINAYDFFKKFAISAHMYAEPGAIFIDNVRGHNILSEYPEDIYKIDVSNPCSEFFGNAGNACNLGSINLYNCVYKPFTMDAALDTDKLKELIDLGVKALDATLDYGYDMQPLQINRDCIDDWRSIGLGFFGLADMFVALGVRYGSKESIELCKTISKIFLETALETSCKLADEKGTFGKYNAEYVLKSPLIASLSNTNPLLYNKIANCGLRNGTLLSIAPTGSIATMCGLSGGLEPYFQLRYERTTHALSGEGQTFTVFTKATEDLLKAHNFDPEGLSDADIKQRFPYVVSTYDIDPFDRVDLQASLQENVDNAISSTVNLKKDATVEDVFNVYLNAWRTGCKGITVFREDCARTSILKSKNDVKEEILNGIVFDSIVPIKHKDMPEDIEYESQYHYKHTACVKNMHGFTNKYDGNLFEIFTFNSGGCTSNIATITRLCSLLFRSGVKIDVIVKELKKNLCPACVELQKQGRTDISKSCGNAIAEMIEEAYKKEVVKVDTSKWLICPSCGARGMNPAEKCAVCKECGFSKCD